MENNLIQIQNLIYEIRGQKVMLDSDIAKLYEVSTKRINEAVKRNIERFPNDFMFQLTDDEIEILRSQNATANISVKSRYNPHVFSRYGVLMLANVLKSQKAIDVSIQIIRVFEQLRQLALENKELSIRLAQIEQYLINHVKDNKAEFKKVYDALNLLMDRTKPNEIGFKIK